MGNTDIEQQLSLFTGTEHYYRMRANMLITDGVKFLAEQANCFWLLDLYWSHLTGIDFDQHPFTVLKMAVLKSAAIVHIEDGNDKILATQFIDYTDFPLASMRLYGCWEDGQWIVMLTSEY